MKTFYLIMGFNRRNQSVFVTDPGLFETEEEAAIYCDKHSDSDIMLGYKLIRLGKMETKKKKIRKLKPCPFCGSKNLTTGHIFWDRFAVECDNCGAHGPVFDVDDVEKDIMRVDVDRIKKWEKCLTKKSIDAWNEWADTREM